MCGMCRESPEYCVVTGTCHAVIKQPIIGGHCYVMVSGLIDCHLLYQRPIFLGGFLHIFFPLFSVPSDERTRN